MIRIILIIIVISLLWELFISLLRRSRGSRPAAGGTDTSGPHEILGVKPGATEEEIKSAYREKIKECHPDRFHGQPEWVKKQAEEMTQKINRAYDMIGKK